MIPITKLSISDFPAVKVLGEYRVLSHMFSTPEALQNFEKFESLDPAQWVECDYSWQRIPILDQGQTSACVGFSSTAAMEYCYKQTGRPLTEFNPFFLYGLINNGRDAGAMLTDSMKALQQFGICSKAALPNGLMFKKDFPQTSFTDALRFKLEKVTYCSTFNDICSAISLGFPTALGIWVGNDFANLDAQGVSPVPKDMRSGGGHALCGIGLKKSAQYGWMIKLQNSWGTKIPGGGFCYIHSGHFNLMAPDAFAVQMISDDPNVPNDVPPVK